MSDISLLDLLNMTADSEIGSVELFGEIYSLSHGVIGDERIYIDLVRTSKETIKHHFTFNVADESWTISMNFGEMDIRGLNYPAITGITLIPIEDFIKIALTDYIIADMVNPMISKIRNIEPGLALRYICAVKGTKFPLHFDIGNTKKEIDTSECPEMNLLIN